MNYSVRAEKKRVILLLDLDSFYAQCECVRLGFPADQTKLALMQWDSCLAVTYPARVDGVKRGDSWDTIAKKSSGSCHAVHVPILVASSEGSAEDADSSAQGFLLDQTLEEEYNSIFKLSAEEQVSARKQDIGRRRSASQGKACIERYRIASAQIFATVFEHIQTYKGVILERASIDEFFLDVSSLCYSDDSAQLPSDEGINEAMKRTCIVGETHDSLEDSEWNALQIGAWVASEIRKAVYSKLKITLSAGVGSNKTVAKLAASYGKPNGQAVVSDVQWLLNDTEINKCRNLGGKLGKSVQALLPPNVPTTVGSIRKYLSLSQLHQSIGNESASWVFNLARGLDPEPVVAKNESALTKSITAFKSLPFSGQGYGWEEVQPWLAILAREVVSRVERDTRRNNRYPRSCTVQYGEKQVTKRNYPFKSLRTSFPAERLSTLQKVDALCKVVERLVHGKEGNDIRIRGIGLCAVDFEQRPPASSRIDSFFKADSPSSGKTTSLPTEQPASNKTIVVTGSDSELAQKLQAQYDGEDRTSRALDEKVSHNRTHRQQETKTPVQVEEGVDIAFARSLQATYDREARVLDAMDKRRSHQRSKKCTTEPKSKKIRNYFSAK